ncbi:hypothetical protein [Brevibacterium luteolum]|uniref:hypothetical protein n=1 Tax=Brevibacterium luteolum TaxID=199591 RepID=UPI001C22C159|nr:hypothetical protein [Brevibacterium luteolum]MBU8578895.1 hypothetical protein [Brevibacterium luteolum]
MSDWKQEGGAAMVNRVGEWTDEAAELLLSRLRESHLELIPKSVIVSEVTDALDEQAWRILLVLSAPKGSTWNRELVFETRRTAIAELDRLAAEQGRSLPGSTVASVTTDEAVEEDIAVDPRPDPEREDRRKAW